MKSRARTFVVLALMSLVPVVGGCGAATGGLTPSVTTTTAVQGWENWLSLDWAASGPDISGYVNSKHGSNIINVRLLAQSLDANGNVVGQKIEWVQGIVPALQRTYFRIPNMPAAQRYRVSVWTFETVESASFL